jgi:hypothetical protein
MVEQVEELDHKVNPSMPTRAIRSESAKREIFPDAQVNIDEARRV